MARSKNLIETQIGKVKARLAFSLKDRLKLSCWYWVWMKGRGWREFDMRWFKKNWTSIFYKMPRELWFTSEHLEFVGSLLNDEDCDVQAVIDANNKEDHG